MHSISADANEWMDLLDIPSDDDGASLADTSDLELMSSFVQQFPPGQHLADFFEQSSSVSLELSLAAANASQDFELREPVVQLKEETVPDDEDEYPETVDPLQVVLQPVILEVMTPPTTPVLGQALSVTRPSHSQPEQPKETVAAAPVPAPPSPLSSSIIVPASMGSGSGTRCMNCNIRSTPLWRRFTAPTESGILCNACGLRIQTSYNMYIHVFMHVVDYKQYNCHRPIGQSVPHASFKRTSASERPVQVPNTSSVVLDLNKVAKKRRRTPAREDVFCENCGCNKTPLWRKNELGQTLCNACGLYFKSHRKHKPVGGTTPPSATSPKPETTLLTTNKDATLVASSPASRTVSTFEQPVSADARVTSTSSDRPGTALAHVQNWVRVSLEAHQTSLEQIQGVLERMNLSSDVGWTDISDMALTVSKQINDVVSMFLQ